LLSLALAFCGLSADVRRQRHHADALDLGDIAFESNDDRSFAFLENACGETIRKAQLVSEAHAPRRFAPRFPGVIPSVSEGAGGVGDAAKFAVRAARTSRPLAH